MLIKTTFCFLWVFFVYKSDAQGNVNNAKYGVVKTTIVNQLSRFEDINIIVIIRFNKNRMNDIVLCFLSACIIY